MRLDLPCTADTAVTFQWHGHEFASSGGKDRIGIRGLSEIALLDFDFSRLQKQGRVVAATLWLTNPAGQEAQLPWVTVSTLRAPWIEGDAPEYALCVGASSFQFRVTRTETEGEPWAWPGSLFTDVVLGRGGSVWFPQQLPDFGKPDADNRLAIDIPPEVIERCRHGFSHGFALFDDRGARDVFTRLCSRHTATPPVLTVVTVPDPGADDPAPAGPAPLARAQMTPIAADPNRDLDAAVRITGVVDQTGHSRPIGYRARIGRDAQSARPLSLWRIPEPPAAAQPAEFDLVECDIAAEDKLFVQAVDDRGRVGAETVIALHPPVPVARPVTLAVEPPPPIELGAAQLGVLWPGDAVRGDGQALSADRTVGEPLQVRWKEGDGRLKLEALAGEILDLPLAVCAPGKTVRIDFSRDALRVPGLTIEAGRAAFVQGEFGRVPDSVAALPVGEWTAGQAAELVYCDLIVWPECAGRTLLPNLVVTIAGRAIELPLEITVLPATLPQTTSFIVELNSYNKFHRYYKAQGDFAAQEWDIQLDFHRQAHRHRCNFNVLPYSQMGTILCDSAPLLDGQGRIADWSAWDRRYLPLLTGQAFTEGLRAGLPVTYFYLPIHENWPGDIRKDYKYNLPIGNTREDYLKALKEHATLAPPIEQCWQPGYVERLWQGCFDFSRHLAAQRLKPPEQGGPILINYFNNKHIYKDPKRVEGVNQRIGDLAGTSWWLLDEPNDWSDWLALRFFGDIVRDGYRRGGANIEWCLDLSRIEWDRDLLYGQRDLVRVSAAFFKYPRLLKRWKRQGSRVLHYGSAQPPEVKPLRETVWAWQIWCRGGDGILPWSSTPMEGFSKGDWLEHPDKLSVIVPVREAGVGAEATRWSRPSLRLKAFRRGQQDADICRLATLNAGVAAPVLGREILRHLGAVRTEAGKFLDEATSIESPDLTSRTLEALRTAVRRLAAQRNPTAEKP